ncbi:MAG: 2-(1,2-epoxy-1,2-dihydrophenyl)acetyl-CoA isomerase PaaG [Sphingomonadaceae bacterium]|nr:2-(1,2-epoxy-1,2-dihydrophenyl)acetyl-CoA isomerase PaaG [Sphingomonadaceae bacterium]
MTYETIRFEQVPEGAARLTFSRPDKMNSFSAAMHAEVADALSAIERDGARVLVLTGAGRAFSAGQDLSERTMRAPGAGVDLGETVGTLWSPLIRRLTALPLPVVAAVNGVAAGAGASIAFACDIVIAAKSARFIQSFAGLGLVPDSGGSWALPRLAGQARALGLALLGDPLPAEQAAAWGLIWRAVPDSDFASEVDALTARLAAAPTLGLAATKRLIRSASGRSLSDQLDAERDAMRELGRSADYAEGVAAFMDKRKPVFRGK